MCRTPHAQIAVDARIDIDMDSVIGKSIYFMICIILIGFLSG